MAHDTRSSRKSRRSTTARSIHVSAADRRSQRDLRRLQKVPWSLTQSEQLRAAPRHEIAARESGIIRRAWA